MFNGKLLKFQTKHEENLLYKCADHEEMVLYAPTGSGKTVMVCKFIDDYLDENPNTLFLWLCPGAGGLQKQSQDSFSELVSGIQYGDVYSFINEPNPVGQVFFINWDKINSSSNIVLKEGEYKDFMSQIYACHNMGIDIFMIIDEEHKYRDTASEYVANINPVHVLRVSATPITAADHIEPISDDEVIGEGLIAMGISVNEGLTKAIQENNSVDDDLMLLKLADEKRKALKKEYENLGLDINPLVVIQFPNGNDEWIEKVKKELSDMGYPESSGFVTSWFSGDHPDKPEELTKLNGEYRFLLFKQAIATGWDCPRAKVLVKLREGENESFQIQTIGRIRRMPERKHYENDLLDHCYLYTLDSKFSEEMTSSLSDTFYTYQYKKKSDVFNVKLTREMLDGNDRISVNPEAVVKVVRSKILEECDLNGDGKIDRKELEKSKGYVFGTVLKTSAIEGVARTTHDMRKLNSIFGGEHEINNHDDGFIIRDAKRRIARAIGIEENISNNALKVLFGPQDMQMSLLSKEEQEFETENKLLAGMSLREYNAFLVNNRDRLVDLFSRIDESTIADVKETKVLEKEWMIPLYQYYKQHKKLAATNILGTNVFEGYGSNILISPNRTCTEIAFEQWCEDGKHSVKHVYKNGDKGDEYFGIVYRKAFRRNHFYPDYIVQTENGDVWIIEAKGGITSDGSSNNIDGYAGKKFDALKSYAERFTNVKWGFVRAVGSQIYMSNTEWDENVMNSDVWKPIEDIMGEE